MRGTLKGSLGRGQTSRVLAPCGALLLTVAGCSVEALWGSDAPRPALSMKDRFRVDPLCPEVVLGSLAAVPRLVSMSGTRFETGLGAESVPVDVFIGSCDGAPSSSDGGLDASASLPGGGVSGASCGADLERLGRLQESELRLHADRGCVALTSRRLSCTLDAEGSALFGISADSVDSTAGLRGYVPVCVDARRIDEDSRVVGTQTEIRAIPRVGSVRVAAAAAVGAPTAPAAGNRCDNLRACEASHAVPISVGLVSVEKPPSTIHLTDFLTLQQAITLEVSVETLQGGGGIAPWLSPGASCGAPPLEEASDAGVGQEPLRVTITHGNSTSLSLCASGYAATYRLTVGVADGGGIETRAADVTVEGLVRAIRPVGSGDVRQLVTERCGAGVTSTTTDDVFPADPVTLTNQGLFLTRPPRCTEPTTDAGAVSPDAGPFECSDATVELASGGTCLLEGAWQ